MKISVFSILFILLCLFVIISSITMSCSSYKPYSPEMMYSAGTLPYANANEGFRNNDYSTYDNSKTNSCDNVNGFNGLLCGPDDSSQNPNEIFSKVKGDLNCKSYGYTNSRGNLCFDENQIKLLSTRGGNA
jgi:hypothetical protein